MAIEQPQTFQPTNRKLYKHLVYLKYHYVDFSSTEKR